MKRSGVEVVPLVRWEGGSGLKSFVGDGRFAVPDPARFQSVWRDVAVDGVHASEWTTSPIAGVLPASRDGRSLVLLAVHHGAMRLWTGNEQVDLRAGSLHLVCGGRPLRFSVVERSRVTRVVVPETFLSPERRQARDFSASAVAATRLTAGLTSIVDQVLDEETGGSSCPAARALRSLAVAAIEDALPESTEEGLRIRMLAFIERQLGDPGLSPRSIAVEFGISLRWTHHVFNVDGASLARHIRERRLDVIAAQLRADRRFPRIGSLAERAGFTNRDQLTRAFKTRYGVTIADYAMLAAENRAPQPLPQLDD